MPAISAARKAAFRILLAVERGNAHADDLLRAGEVSALGPADRNLATALVLGVLRWQIFLDQLIRPLLKRPKGKLDAEVLIALRLGAFQLRFLDRIPARAAIDESVELTKHAGHRFAAGMVNAVLRNVAREGALGEARSELVPRPHDLPPLEFVLSHPSAQKADERMGHGAVPLQALSVVAAVQAHPAWLVERWTAIYGAEAMRTICVHGQSQPRMVVRIGSSSVEEELRKAGIELEPGELLTAARTVVHGDVTATAAFREGRVRVQDEGSQLIGELASGAELVRDQEKILDACAAPGGKTLILAERNPRARIVACESSPRRLAELRKRLAGFGDRVECRLADAAALTEESAFDVALADVPCTGTGTLGRNPEIRHRLKLDDLPRFGERQRGILGAALRAVRPGGRVFYATCSLEPEENEQVVAAVLAENASARQVSLAAVIEALRRNGILREEAAEPLRKCLTREGALRLLPGGLPTDGFFVALLERGA